MKHAEKDSGDRLLFYWLFLQVGVPCVLARNGANVELQEELVHVLSFFCRFDINRNFLVVHHLLLSTRNIFPTNLSLIFTKDGVIGVLYATQWFKIKAICKNFHGPFNLTIWCAVKHC